MNIILREWRHYNTLSLKTRLLISSFALRGIAQPLLSLFINSFIWRSTSSFSNVAIYNLGFFIFLPLGFYVNGLLLKRIKITKLYLVGLIISTISTIAVIFFSGNNLWYFLAYGAIFGFGSGIYWANRNFLGFQETKSKQRNYFFSITSVLNSLINLLVTFVVGWFIVLGERSNSYTPTMAYWIFSILALGTLILSGIIILKTDYKSPKIKNIIQFHISPKWNKARFVSFNMGLLEGITFFLPTLLILFYLGKEGALGTISTITTLFIVAITYLYGRLAEHNHRKPIFFVSLALYLVFAALLILLNHPLNILVFVLLSGIATVFQWLTIEPALLDIMDKEINQEQDNQYTLVFDREVFLNIGRIISVLILFFIIKLTSQQTGLLFTPLILGICQLIFMSFVWKKNTL